MLDPGMLSREDTLGNKAEVTEELEDSSP